MENISGELPGVTVFQDNMLVSGHNANEHVSKLMHLFSRLNHKGLICRCDNYLYGLPSRQYFGYTLSAEGIVRGSKVRAVLKMPIPTNVSSLKFFLGPVQFYEKFIPDLDIMEEQNYRLTKKSNTWK